MVPPICSTNDVTMLMPDFLDGLTGRPNDVYNKDEFVAAMDTGLNLIEYLIKPDE